MKNSDIISIEGPSLLIQTSVLCARSAESKDYGWSPSTAPEKVGGFSLAPEPLWASVSAVINWEYINELLPGIKRVCEVLPARPGSPSTSLKDQEPTGISPPIAHFLFMTAVATSHPKGNPALW